MIYWIYLMDWVAAANKRGKLEKTNFNNQCLFWGDFFVFYSDREKINKHGSDQGIAPTR